MRVPVIKSSCRFFQSHFIIISFFFLFFLFPLCVHFVFRFACLNSGGGLLHLIPVKMNSCEYDNGLNGDGDVASMEVDYVEKDPSGRFIRICWYFTDSWEQFRINGAVDGSNSDPIKLQQREKAWFASSPKSGLQYLGPNPGIPSLGDQLTEVPSSLDPSSGPVEAFCLLVLDPDQVDYLNLKSNERISFSRKIANEEISWISEKVNP